MSRAILLTLAGSLMLHGAAQAQTLGQGPESVVPAWRVAASLAVCLILAVAAAFALRARLRGAGPHAKIDLLGLLRPHPPSARRLELVETLRLSHQVDVCLLRCEDRRFLVAAGPSGATLLSELAPDEDRP